MPFTAPAGVRSAPASDMRLYLRILRYLGPYKGLLAGVFLASLGFAALDAFSIALLLPFLSGLLQEGAVNFSAVPNEALSELLANTAGRVIPPDAAPLDVLTSLAVFILAVFMVKNVFDYLQKYLGVILEQRVARDVRVQVYDHLLELGLRFFGLTRGGQIISRMTGDIELLRNLVTRNLAKFITSVLQMVFFVAIMIALSGRLTVIALVVIPGVFAVWRKLISPLKRGDRKILHLAGEVTSHLQETVAGVRQVKAASAEHFEAGRFRELAQHYYKAVVRTERIRALASPLSETMSAVGVVLLLWYGGRIVLVESPAAVAAGGAPVLTATGLIIFLAATLKLYEPTKWLSRFPSMVQPGLTGAARVFEFLDTRIDVPDRSGAVDFPGLERGVRFEAVSFAYDPAEAVLRDVDLAVAPGEVVALVGASGAGKTTLVDLVARFYDPTAGRITVDGVDLRDIRGRSLRDNLGIVTQETVIFHDTVRANIAYARPEASPEAVERAARMANAHDFIVQLPEGYDTVLGERGTRLSGGQRQRIAIARAILRDPPILIFDEATSSLDTESERLVQEAIEHLLQGRTVFVIAHRLSTVRHADQILVLDAGRIVQRGTHDELLAAGGRYRHLYRLQFAAADEAAVTTTAVEGELP